MTKLTNLKETIENYDFALSLDPRYHEAYYGRGVAKYALGRIEEALEDFNRTIELYERFSKAYQMRGLINEKLGEKEKAENNYRKAKRLDPDAERDVKMDLDIAERQKAIT